MELTRYWIKFDWPRDEPWAPALGFGVTAYSRDDALSLLQREYFDRFQRAVPPVAQIEENVDVATLDERHVLPDMDPPIWRGVWYPRLKPLS